MRSLTERLNNAMSGFFKNIGNQVSAKDIIKTSKGEFSLNGYSSKVYIVENPTRYKTYPSYFETRIYYSSHNQPYDKLDIRFDISKIKRDFGGLINFNGCDEYEITQAWLHYINLLSIDNRNAIINYISKYSNISKWSQKSNSSYKLSYGDATDTELITDEENKSSFNEIVFSIYKHKNNK